MGSERHDRWLLPVEITEDENQFVVDAGEFGLDTFTIPVGKYYMARGPVDIVPDGFRLLYQEMIDAVLADPATGYEIDGLVALTPSGYELENSGILIFFTVSADLRFDHENWTLPPEYLGFPDDQSESVSTPVTSPKSSFGKWLSVNIVDNEPTSKFAYPTQEVYWSTRERRRNTRQTTTDTEERKRNFLYEDVPGLAVMGGSERSSDPLYAAPAKVGVGDENNVFLDVWRAAVQVGPIIVVHDDGGDPNSIRLDQFEDKLEVVDILERGDAEDPRRFLIESNTSGELFDIDLDVLVVRSNYDY